MALYSRTASTPDVLVAGGGIIGLAVAWRAREAGLRVGVLERERVGAGASHVAAGMLAPVAEVELGEHGRRTLDLGLRSAALWDGFARELSDASGEDVDVKRTGTLMVARDDDEARELERQHAFRDSLGVRALRLRPSQAREREPALAPTIRLALEAPDDHSVEPRRVVGALRRACERAGVAIEEGAHVRGVALDPSGRRAEGLALADGTRRRAGCVVLAAGAWSGGLDAGGERLRAAVRPVKGQLIHLRDRAGSPLVGRAVRCPGAYLVPREDGRLVVGGTVEERGFDLAASAGAVYELLRAAHELVPGVTELDLEEICVGVRPGTPDNAPIVGHGDCERVVWATGHYRNGILLAPLTAALVLGLLLQRPPDPLLAVCDPRRPSLHADHPASPRPEANATARARGAAHGEVRPWRPPASPGLAQAPPAGIAGGAAEGATSDAGVPA